MYVSVPERVILFVCCQHNATHPQSTIHVHGIILFTTFLYCSVTHTHAYMLSVYPFALFRSVPFRSFPDSVCHLFVLVIYIRKYW